MKVALVGNCQVGCLKRILESIHSGIECSAFPAVHQIEEKHRTVVEDFLNQSDWIFTQPISDAYHVKFVGPTVLKSAYGGKLVVWSNCYFDGYAPEWVVLRDVENLNYPGPLLHYHNSKILYCFFSGVSQASASEFVVSSSDFDHLHYSGNVSRSFNVLRQRDTDTDVSITEFVADNYREQRLFHIMNHPSLRVMGELSSKLLTMVGEPFTPPFPNLLADYDMISVWHPENPYVRETEGLRFKSLNLYRGVGPTPKSKVVSYELGRPRLYTLEDLVGAFYSYYESKRETLSQHATVRSILEKSRLLPLPTA